MSEEIKMLTEALRTMRQKKTIDELKDMEFSPEYAGLVQEINELIGFGTDWVRQEKSKLHMIHQVISSGMWSMYFDENGDIEQVIWSQEFRHMLGFRGVEDFPDQLDSWSDRLHPDDKEATMKAYWHTVHEAGKYDVEYRLLTNEGKYRWYHAIGETSRQENGKPRLFIGVFIDITQKKEKERAIEEKLKAQEALKQIKKELQAKNEILNALCADFNSVYIVDLDTGRYKIHLMADSLPKSVSEISESNKEYDVAIDQYITRWVSEEDADFIRFMTERERVKQTLSERKRFSLRYRVKDREDGQKNFEFSFCDISKKPGEHIMVFGARNVDALIGEKEDCRKETLSQVENTLAGAQTGLWNMELGQGAPIRMYGDKTMKKLLGMKEELPPEDYYRKWYDGIGEDYRERIEAVLERSVSGEFREAVYPCSYPGRGKGYMRIGAVQDKNCQAVGGYCLRGYCQDITETMKEKQLKEEELVAALMEAKQASRVKTEFLSHMSHDIRTPINGILGLLTIAEKEENSPDRQRDCHQKIRKSAEHLLSLVNDVLDISRMESGAHSLMEETFDINDVLDSCMSILRPQAELEGIRWNATRGEFRHSRLRGSGLHLRQILINIVGNAVKYNKKNGAIYIETREIQQQDGQIWFQFRVSDTGIGMSQEYQKHIFEPFTQANSGARTAYAGSGLGMAITKKLVDQMGGSIQLESMLGKGSTFTVRLPFKPEEADAENRQEDETSQDVSGMKVLVAEDNELNREIVQYILEDAGAEPVTAGNGKIALDIFAESDIGEFDCIVMDVMMPVMDGLEATRQIRKLDRPDAGTIPVIALSANAFKEDIERTMEAGMDRHVSKPLDAEKLFRIMAALKKSK